jgi:hypothetical protein
VAMILRFGYVYPAKNCDSARAVGDVALSGEREVRSMKSTMSLEKKKARREAFEKQRNGSNHHILEHRPSLSTDLNSTVDFPRRNRVLERGVEGVGRSAEWVADSFLITGPHIRSQCDHYRIEQVVNIRVNHFRTVIIRYTQGILSPQYSSWILT